MVKLLYVTKTPHCRAFLIFQRCKPEPTPFMCIPQKGFFTKSSSNFNTFTAANLSIAFHLKRGKSGQHRASYFLTGRAATSDGCGTESAAEN